MSESYLTEEEKQEILRKEAQSKQFILDLINHDKDIIKALQMCVLNNEGRLFE